MKVVSEAEAAVRTNKQTVSCLWSSHRRCVVPSLKTDHWAGNTTKDYQCYCNTEAGKELACFFVFWYWSSVLEIYTVSKTQLWKAKNHPGTPMILTHSCLTTTLSSQWRSVTLRNCLRKVTIHTLLAIQVCLSNKQEN